MADELPLDQATQRFKRNEQSINTFVNAPEGEQFYETSEGERVPTLPKLLPTVEDLTAQAAAEVGEARRAASAAEAARDAAIVSADTYQTESEGLAAVGDGETFDVQGSSDVAVIRYRRINAGLSERIAEFPSAQAVRQTGARVGEVRNCLAEYLGSADIIPLYTDAVGRVLLGVHRSSGDIFASGVGPEIAEQVLGENEMAIYLGDGPVYPLATDLSGRVLLGVDRATGRLVGAFPEPGAGEIPAALPEPLSEPVEWRAFNHLLFYGQSLSVGAAAGAVLSTTQPYYNVTFAGGPRAWTGAEWDFSGLKLLVEDAISPAPDGGGNRAETPCSGAANLASTLLALAGVNPEDHVVLASTAGRGGYRINQLEKGTPWYPNFLAHVQGAHDLDADHAVHAVGWLQGEADVGVTDYAAYLGKLTALQSDINADVQAKTGQTHPVYLLTYQLSWGVKNSPDIALAHLAAAQANEHIYLVTPTYHLPHATDRVHLTAAGYKWIGGYYGRAYAALVSGVKPRWLNPVSATIKGKTIRVRFDVPHGPLVIDRQYLAATEDNGFRVLDGSTAADIAGMSIDGRDVILELADTPSDPVTVRYGLDYLGVGLTLANGASGNLRDSSPESISVDGVSRPLWNPCPAFSMSAIKLGE